MNSIVFFYAEVMDYVEGTFMSIVNLHPTFTIHVVYWDHGKVSQYQHTQRQNVYYYKRSDFSDAKSLFEFLHALHPKIVCISGWMDSDYIKAVKMYKRDTNFGHLVAGIDSQWFGSIRQIAGSLIMRFYYRKIFDYVWIAGKPQYYYARRMGFSAKKIISNLYSANSHNYLLSAARFSFEKRFLYVGRLIEKKGLINLIEAYLSLDKETQAIWPLQIVGEGPLKAEIERLIDGNNISLLSFKQGDDLLNEYKKGGVFCLPSFFEPWGVVVHEAALMRMPLLLSSNVGSRSEYLVEGYNGYSFDSKNIYAIRNALNTIAKLNTEDLLLYANRSAELGNRTNSDISAASLMSILTDE